MDLTKNNQRKAQMLLYELEKSLGQYILKAEPTLDDLPQKTILSISKRNKERGINADSIEELLEATYLDEIFHFALEITKNTSMYKYINELMQIFKLNEIFTIRNTIAHPNKKFINQYWYKIATVASSPTIEIIGLDGVKKALISSEMGQIEDPPSEWLKEITSDIIPNNLPKKLEHNITGLVGRTSEEKDLLKLLQNPRIPTIGIVASGGIGKTALVLDLLHKLVFQPKTAEWCDTIVSIDMKTEQLTSSGIKKLDAINTMQEINNQLIQVINNLYSDKITNIDDLLEKYKDKKLLIFIDNLETIIRDNENEFENFNMSLPRDWRLLITSRIAISSASIIALKELNTKSAIHLARLYTSKSGKEMLSDDNYKQVVLNCHNNPLAIRLTLDLYIMGNELSQSIHQSSQMIAEFSFQNLIEKLSNNSIKILEALFIDQNIDRIKLCELLSLSIDEIMLSISELSKTSLISRKSENDTEYFNLSSSIRELLLKSPRNIEIRNEIKSKLSKINLHSQEIEKTQSERGLNELHLDYIPENINNNLKILISKLNSSYNKYKISPYIVSKFYTEFITVKERYNDEFMYHRSIGKIYSAMRDTDNAIKSYNHAIKLKNDDFISIYLLATVYFYDNSDYENAEKLYYELIENANIGKNKWFRKVVSNGYFLSLLYQHNYEEVLKKTSSWEGIKDDFIRGIFGTYRASAWRRKLENHSLSNDEYMEALNNSIDTFDSVFQSNGYIDTACIQAIKLIDEIEVILKTKRFDDDIVLRWLNFIDKHIINIAENNSKMDLNTLITSLAERPIKNNTFQEKKWNNYVSSDFSNIISEEYALTQNYTIVQISKIPEFAEYEYTKYIFTEGEDKSTYLVHFTTLVNNNWEDWKSFTLKMKLAIKPVKADNGMKSIETHIIE
jgi:hypothetical protein